MRQGQLPEEARAISWKAEPRLCKRFRRMIPRDNHPKHVVTAIARELVGYMRAIAKELQQAQVVGWPRRSERAWRSEGSSNQRKPLPA